MRKIIRVISALFLSVALTAFTACDVFGGMFNKPSNGGSGDGSGSSQPSPSPDGSSGGTYTYLITFVLDGGTLSEEMSTYVAGEEVDLPTATKEHYSFLGWYRNSEGSGEAVTKIAATDVGPKTFYAKWAVDTFTVSLIVDGKPYAGKDNVTSYSYDSAKALPLLTQSGYDFSGWYADSNLNGTAVTEIPLHSTGNKTYYAKFISVNELSLTSYGGYEEGAYVEFNAVSGVNDYSKSVTYKSKSGANAYQTIDKELIRVDNGKVRADIVGLKAGEYTVKVVAGDKQVEKDVTVTAYDRSGYAHFNLSGSSYSDGVGGYNNDGTPKDGAYIIYVNEATKNSVKAPWDNEIKGIANILSNSKIKGKTVIVRVLGTVGAATWKEGKVTYTKTSENTDSKGNLKASAIVGKNGKQLPTASKTYQADLETIYNDIDETVYTKLDGLTSYISYSSGAYDSCWNNCSISEASNVTVEGIGTDATLFQWGMTWVKCNSIEVRNLTFDDYTEDACSFEGNSGSESATSTTGFTYNRFWVHNCTFNRGVNYWDVTDEQDKKDGDGCVDFKRLSNVTVSYNKFDYTHKTGLVGADDASLTANITFHHNYYVKCQSRLPMSRQANMHMYNNYYKDISSSCIDVRSGGYAFVEYCYFDNPTINSITIKQGTKKVSDSDSLRWGFVKLYQCSFASGSKKYDSSVADYVNEASARNASNSATNCQNRYDKNFDTNSSIFYYDATNKCSDVTNLIKDVSTIPTLIPQLAGVHKNK